MEEMEKMEMERTRYAEKKEEKEIEGERGVVTGGFTFAGDRMMETEIEIENEEEMGVRSGGGRVGDRSSPLEARRIISESTTPMAVALTSGEEGNGRGRGEGEGDDPWVEEKGEHTRWTLGEKATEEWEGERAEEVLVAVSVGAESRKQEEEEEDDDDGDDGDDDEDEGDSGKEIAGDGRGVARTT